MAVKAKMAPARERSARTDTVFECGLNPDAKVVYLVGDFNNWDPQADRMRKYRGSFRKALTLPSGDYQYKFIVDGEWRHDPAAATQLPNEFGTLNSVVHVKVASDK